MIVLLYLWLGVLGVLAIGFLQLLAWTALTELIRWRRRRPFRRLGYLDLRVRRDP